MEFFELLMPIFTEYGYLAVFVMLLICGFGVPVPEDVTLVTGGVIAGLGYANEHTMFAVGMAGVLDSARFAYFLAEKTGVSVQDMTTPDDELVKSVRLSGWRHALARVVQFWACRKPTIVICLGCLAIAAAPFHSPGR